MKSPDLTIRLKRHSDGSASLTLTRADGTVTWQRQQGSLGLVFPPHDLTHFAVETELAYRGGFYGLVADGWDVGDFAVPWPRGPIPEEAREVELIVGFFDAERRSLDRWSAAAFDEHAEKFVGAARAVVCARARRFTEAHFHARMITRNAHRDSACSSRSHAAATHGCASKDSDEKSCQQSVHRTRAGWAYDVRVRISHSLNRSLRR